MSQCITLGIVSQCITLGIVSQCPSVVTVFCYIQPLIEDILQKQEEQNAHVEQTIRLLNTRLLIDRERVERLRSKIDAYT